MLLEIYFLVKPPWELVLLEQAELELAFEGQAVARSAQAAELDLSGWPLVA